MKKCKPLSVATFVAAVNPALFLDALVFAPRTWRSRIRRLLAGLPAPAFLNPFLGKPFGMFAADEKNTREVPLEKKLLCHYIFTIFTTHVHRM